MKNDYFQNVLKNFEGKLVADIPFHSVTNNEDQKETLHLDIYLPSGNSQALYPAVLWFHAGAFRPGNDKRQVYIPRFASAFADLGYAGIAPDYRVRPDPTPDFKATVRDAVADGRAALDWVRKHAPEYQIDPGQIGLADAPHTPLMHMDQIVSEAAQFFARMISSSPQA